jgi:hypothetical protein
MPNTFQRTLYHLTEEQVHFFDENGYLILRKWIPKKLLQKLQEAGSGWIRQGWELDAAGKIQQEPGIKILCSSNGREEGDVPGQLPA